MTRTLPSRRSQRRPVSVPTQCRTQSGLRDRGQITDLSAEGCCVQIRGHYFRTGVRLFVRPDGLEGLTGIVRWVVDDIAGVEFDRPIYQPVVDHLVRLHGVGEGT